jgi:sugar lactone lactonase YvrE
MRAAAVVATNCLATGTAAAARDVPVTTADELLAAIADAAPGDVITLAPGTYAMTGASCAAAGTAAEPIVVRADPPLEARIDFDALEGFRVTGAHWHFEGLDVHGVCAADDDCEHAFHVSGAADGFVMRGCRVVDFNAQLKVNAQMIGSTWETPDDGLIEGNELFDTRARDTGNPVTKLNIDTGDDWILRGNDIHDFEKGGGDGVSYAAFLKSGGNRGLMERNLVRCTTTGGTGTRIGLSLGGGGTAPQFCAPAFDASVPCSIEHHDGTLRKNIVIGCSDVGVYLNRAASTKILHNTLIATAGIDFRFDTTSGEAVGNVLAGAIRMRDGGTFTGAMNLENVDAATFAGWYVDAPGADLSQNGDQSALIGHGLARADVPDDYCTRTRPDALISLGAIEHSLGSCVIVPPPGGVDAPDAGPGVGDDDDDGGGGADGGCCDASGGQPAGGAVLLALVLLVGMRSPRRLVILIMLLLAGACGGGGSGDDGDDDVVAIDASLIDGTAPDGTPGCGTEVPPLASIRGTEGIAIAADGTVYYSQNGHVGRWVPNTRTPDDGWVALAGTSTVWGMAVNAAGVLDVATPSSGNTPGTIWRIDTTVGTPAATVLDDQAGDPNGLTLGPDGAVYYTDFNGDDVWRVDDLGDRVQVSTSAIASANGVLFDADGTLLVASYQTGTIHRLTLDAGHQETARVDAFTGTGSPDGLARDELGRTYVTDNGGGVVLRFTPGDDTPEELLTGVSSAANLAFGRGPLACQDVYVTSSGALRGIDAGASGVP